MPADQSTPPGWRWYVVALSLALIGWVGGVIVSATAWDQVRAAPIGSINRPLMANGASVAVFTDVLQSDLAIACSWRTKGAWHPVRPASIPLAVDDDGLTWQLIALEPHGEDDLKVRCHPTRGRTDHAQYGVSVVDGFTQRSELGRWIRVASMAIGAVVVVIAFIRRRRATLTP